MEDSTRSHRKLDAALMAEIALALGLLASALFFFWIPASRDPFVPRWWSVPLLIALFFGLIALHRWRKREQGRDELHQAVQDARDGTEDVEHPPRDQLDRTGVEGAPLEVDERFDAGPDAGGVPPDTR